MTSLFCFMLGELEISNITACGLAVVALVFLGNFAVVSLQTGELIKPPRRSSAMVEIPVDSFAFALNGLRS